MAGVGSHVGVGIVAAASAATGVASAANTAAVGGQGDTALGAPKNAALMGSDAYLPLDSHHPLVMVRRPSGHALFRAVDSAMTSLLNALRPRVMDTIVPPVGMSYGAFRFPIPQRIRDWLDSGPSAEVIKKLKKFGTMECKGAIQGLIDNPDAKTLSALLGVLTQGDLRERILAGDALVALGELAIPDLTKFLGSDSILDVDRSNDILFRISKRGGRVEAAILKAATDPNRVVRRRAIGFLARLPLTQKTEIAIQIALSDPDKLVRHQALNAANQHDLSVNVPIEDF